MRTIAAPDPPLRDGAVLLRPIGEEDVPALVEACQDPLILRFNTSIPDPYGEREARTWLGTHAGGLRTGRELSLAIAEAGNGTLAGVIGVSDIDHRQRRAEIGYWVAAPARRRGYATRALRLLGDWALAPDGLGLARLQLTTDVENPASQRVAERAGFECEGLLRAYVEHQGARRDMVVWSRLAPGQ